MDASPSRKRRLWSLVPLVVALLFGSLFYLLKPAPIERLALQAEDLKFSLRQMLGFSPTMNPEVMIVAVDEASINRLGRWPWNREHLARLIAGLAQAKAVGLDIVFSESADAAQDAALGQALAAADNVVCGYFFRGEESASSAPEVLALLSESAYREVKSDGIRAAMPEFPRVETNILPIAENCLGSAFFNAFPDVDGLYRRYPLAFVFQGSLYPPLAVQMYRFGRDREAYLDLDAGGLRTFTLGDFVLHGDNYLPIDFPAFDAHDWIAAADIIEGKIAPERFAGKLVVVGTSETGIFDMRPTPVHPVTPGLWLHASALSNLLAGAPLRHSPAIDLSLLLILCLLTAAIGALPRLRRRLPFYLLLLLCLGAFSLYVLITGRLWLRDSYLFLGLFMQMSGQELVALFRTERQAASLRQAFTSYVSPDVVTEILRNPERLQLGGSERNISILFADIRGFTSLTETLPPPRLVYMLGQIQTPLTEVILRERGMLDKYIGDGLMALFNAPLDVAGHPARAVRAALEMFAVLEGVNQRFAAEGLPAVSIGIGINTGRCIVGNIGSQARLAYTAIGDAVNVASRIEGLCKIYRCRLLISATTRAALREEFVVRSLGKVRVMGRGGGVEVFEVLADSAENRRLRDRFVAALQLYQERQFAAALEIFTALEREGDRTAAVFTERCQLYVAAPPGTDWEGIDDMRTK